MDHIFATQGNRDFDTISRSNFSSVLSTWGYQIPFSLARGQWKSEKWSNSFTGRPPQNHSLAITSDRATPNQTTLGVERERKGEIKPSQYSSNPLTYQTLLLSREFLLLLSAHNQKKDFNALCAFISFEIDEFK